MNYDYTEIKTSKGDDDEYSDDEVTSDKTVKTEEKKNPDPAVTNTTTTNNNSSNPGINLDRVVERKVADSDILSHKPGANPTNFFPYFDFKLGHFIENKIILICYKRSNLTARIRKRLKIMFGWIDSCCMYVNT